jgi:hypothetical protein
MRKAVFIIMACLLTGWSAAATLVDDFDSYTPGAVGTVTEKWEGTANATIAVDPVDNTNKVIQIAEGGGTGQQSAYGILSSEATVANNTTKTMFLRFKATAALDESFGLTNVDAPLLGGDQWTDFRVQVAVVNGTIRARDGSLTRTLANTAGTQIAVNTNWYNLWVIVDNAADTIKLYLNQNGDSGATEADLLVNVASLTQSTFAFRTATTEALDRFYWRAQNNTNTRMLMIDDIYIMSGTDLSNPAGVLGAHNPTPAHGATNVATDTTLSWYTGVDPANPANPNPNITKHYVYMREGDPNLVGYQVDTITASGTIATYTPPTDFLKVDKTYYWRVDESVNNSLPSDPNTIKGSTWRFDAVKSVPTIITQPKDTTAAPTETAQFSLKATISSGTMQYTWYKTPDAVTNTPIGDIEKTDTDGEPNILTLPNVAVVGDEGYYFCKIVKVDNETNPVYSNVVKLGVNRKMAHWTLNQSDYSGGKYLDKNLEDTIHHDAEPNGVPDFSVNGADGTPNGAVTIDPVNGYASAGTWNPSEMTNRFTISLWAKWAGQTTPTTWQGLVSKETSYGSGNMMWQLEVTNAAQASSTVVLKNGLETGNLSTPVLPVGAWEHIAVTFDGTTATVYRNGVSAASGAWTMGTKIDAPVNIGISARSLTENLMFNGALDDVQIYNYALDKYAVADIYNAVTGKNVCIETYASTHDFNNDCKITFEDFVMIAANWQSSGLYSNP